MECRHALGAGELESKGANLQGLDLGLALLPLVEGLNGELGDVADGLAIARNLFPSHNGLRIVEFSFRLPRVLSRRALRFFGKIAGS